MGSSGGAHKVIYSVYHSCVVGLEDSLATRCTVLQRYRAELKQRVHKTLCPSTEIAAGGSGGGDRISANVSD